MGAGGGLRRGGTVPLSGTPRPVKAARVRGTNPSRLSAPDPPFLVEVNKEECAAVSSINTLFSDLVGAV